MFKGGHSFLGKPFTSALQVCCEVTQNPRRRSFLFWVVWSMEMLERGMTCLVTLEPVTKAKISNADLSVCKIFIFCLSWIALFFLLNVALGSSLFRLWRFCPWDSYLTCLTLIMEGPLHFSLRWEDRHRSLSPPTSTLPSPPHYACLSDSNGIRHRLHIHRLNGLKVMIDKIRLNTFIKSQ